MITDFLTPDPRSVIEMLFAVSALIILVLLARKPIAREFGPGIAYALWLVPLARLLLPPLPTNMSWVSLLGLAPRAAHADAPGDTAALAVNTPVFIEAPAVALAPGAEGANLAFISKHAPAVDAPADWLTASGLGTALVASIIGAWLIGGLVVLARNMAAQHSFMAVVHREKTPASAHLQSVADQVARQIGLKHTPQIAMSLISNGPLVTGLFRPVVLLPAWFEADYDDAQQRAALAHEMTHVKRGDLWALQLAELFVACLWFNPLAYMARRAFRTDQEAACDSDVLRCGAASPHAYGSTLLKAVRISVPERLPLAASLPLTHSLKERMRLLTYPTPSRQRRLAGLGLAGLLGSAALIATASVTASASEPGEGLTKSIMIDNSTLFIDGEQVEDRQFVLLGEPYDHTAPQVDEQIRHLSHRIEQETRKLRLPSPVPSAPPLPPMPEMPPMPAAPAVPTAHKVMELKGANEDTKHAFVFDFEANAEDAEKNAAEWEAWAQEFEARTSEWEALVDERMASWEAEYDADSEAVNQEIEAHVEAWANEIETRVEAAYGDGMEDRFSEVANSLETLAVSCRDASLATGETRILSRETASGKAINIACIQGDASRLRAPETRAAIESSDLLGDEEKQTFTIRLKENRKIEISKH